jgi:hypothetical protein
MPGKHYTDSPSGRVIVAALEAHAPASIETLVRLTGYQKRTVRDMVLKLHSDGRVHVAEYRHEWQYAPAPAKLWAPGPGTDAERVSRPRARSRHANWVTSDAAGRILERLTCGDCSIKTLTVDACVSDGNARTLIGQMIAARVVHLSAWRTAAGLGGNHTQVYRLGPGREAKRPAARAKKVLYQEWRQRKIEKYGREAAGAMLRSRSYGGAERIVIDGRTVYQRKAAA